MAGHQSVIIGLRELDATETITLCSTGASEPPRSDQPFRFTANYRLRSYVSGCYYLDADSHWRSDGLLVSFLPVCSLTHERFVVAGRTDDQSQSNAMSVHPLDDLRRRFPGSACARELELCVRQRRVRTKQDHLHHPDLCVHHLSSAGDLWALQGQERSREGEPTESRVTR